MRLAFLGTPQFAVPTLAALIDAKYDVAAVYTRAPKPAGRRGLELTRSPVHVAADNAGLDVRTPPSLKGGDAAATLAALAVDVAVVVGYGLLLPAAILEAPRHGCLNLHPSRLPRWRGAAPIQRAIMAGDRETAATIMKMDENLDTGPVALEETVAIAPTATAGDMHDLLAAKGAALMVQALEHLAHGTLSFRAQSAKGVTYAEKIGKAEARIDWRRTAAEVVNLVRGLSPSPGAFVETDLGRGPERIKVLRASVVDGASGAPGQTLDDALMVACAQGAIRLETLQRAGRGPTDAAAFLRGTSVPAGTAL